MIITRGAQPYIYIDGEYLIHITKNGYGIETFNEDKLLILTCSLLVNYGKAPIIRRKCKYHPHIKKIGCIKSVFDFM